MQISSTISDVAYWGFIAVLLVNLTQRRHQKQAQRKRFATLWIGLAGFALFILTEGAILLALPDWASLVAIALIVATVYIFREHTWPFRLRTPGGRRLSVQEILYDDTPEEEREEQ